MALWIGIVGGIIVGWLIEWIIDWTYWRRQLPDIYAAQGQLQRERSAAQQELEQVTTDYAELRDEVTELRAQNSDLRQKLTEALSTNDRSRSI